MKYKYPRTSHVPWSQGYTADDKKLVDMSCFLGKAIVVTEKMDGENTTIGKTYTHARSLDSGHHESRNWVKQFAAQWQHLLDDDIRVCRCKSSVIENGVVKSGLRYVHETRLRESMEKKDES